MLNARSWMIPWRRRNLILLVSTMTHNSMLKQKTLSSPWLNTTLNYSNFPSLSAFFHLRHQPSGPGQAQTLKSVRLRRCDPVSVDRRRKISTKHHYKPSWKLTIPNRPLMISPGSDLTKWTTLTTRQPSPADRFSRSSIHLRENSHNSRKCSKNRLFESGTHSRPAPKWIRPSICKTQWVAEHR